MSVGRNTGDLSTALSLRPLTHLPHSVLNTQEILTETRRTRSVCIVYGMCGVILDESMARFRRMLLTVIIAYGVVLIAGCAWQRRLLYFPSRLSSAAADDLAAVSGFVPWKSGSDEIIGWRILGPEDSAASLLIFHGNAGHALHRGYMAQPAAATGRLDVYVFEYPGYGARAGSPGMKAWLGAVEEAMERLPQDRPVYVASESIGAGVAAHVARTYPDRVGGLLLIVPFDNLVSLAQSHMPLLLPRVFLRDRYDPSAWLKEYNGPIKVVLAEDDTIIPPRFGQKLYDEYRGPKTLEIISGAGHNDVAEQTLEWWEDVIRFWESQDEGRPE